MPRIKGMRLGKDLLTCIKLNHLRVSSYTWQLVLPLCILSFRKTSKEENILEKSPLLLESPASHGCGMSVPLVPGQAPSRDGQEMPSRGRMMTRRRSGGKIWDFEVSIPGFHFGSLFGFCRAIVFLIIGGRGHRSPTDLMGKATRHFTFVAHKS